jgi:hypothetical protein
MVTCERRGTPGRRGAAGCVAALLLLVSACVSVDHVDAVTVHNPTDYRARVMVSGDDGGNLSLGVVQPNGERTVGQVVEQGATWTFRFMHPEHEETVTYPRDELERASWRVEVPAGYGEALEQLDVAPSEVP